MDHLEGEMWEVLELVTRYAWAPLLLGMIIGLVTK